MNAEEAIKQGQPREALKLLQDVVRKNPADARQRLFLTQLLAVLGELERAQTQLELVGELDAEAMLFCKMYQGLFEAESFRRKVFAGLASPVIFGDQGDWIGMLLLSLQHRVKGEIQAATQLRDQAYAAAPVPSGNINGETFEWILDRDVRLGPMLEVVVAGQYYWMPLACIKTLEAEGPKDLRDLAWLPVKILLTNTSELNAFIPARYPGSEQSTDGQIILGQAADWTEAGGGGFLGIGQRYLYTNQQDYPLHTLRRLEMVPAAQPSSATS